MMTQTAAAVSHRPAPYSFNAILAYAATLGWGINKDATPDQIRLGRDLFWYETGIKSYPFIRGGPITLPASYLLPAFIAALGGTD